MTNFYLLTPLFTAILGVLDLLFFQKTIGNSWGDILAAFPISKEYAKPNLYSSSDLLIYSAKNIPFHLYKFASILIRQEVDIEKAWFFLTVVFLLLIFMSVWYLSYSITGNYFTSTISTIIIAHSYSTRGTLNWSFFPPTSLISSTLAMPFAIFSISLFLKKRLLSALIISAVTYNLHPFGLIIYILVALYTVFISIETRRRKYINLLISLVVLSPTLIFTMKSLPANFIPITANEMQTYLEYYRLNAYHAYIEDHFKEGYGWFFIHIMGSFYFLRSVKSENTKRIYWAYFVFFALIATYSVNLYLLKIIPITLLYLFRVTYLLKPIVYSLIVSGCIQYATAKKIHFRHYTLRSISIAMLSLSVIWSDLFIAESLALFGYLMLMLNSKDRSIWYLSITGIALFTSAILLQPYLPVLSQTKISIGYIIYSAIIFFSMYFYPPMVMSFGTSIFYKYQKILSVIIVIVLISGYILIYGNRCILRQSCISAYTNRWTRFEYIPKAENRELIEWVRSNTKEGTMFLIPPVDSETTDHLFQQFRLVSERGVYFSYYDVNQLAYDVSAYLETFRRFQVLKFQSVARHIFDFSSYNHITDNDLYLLKMNEKIDYAIFVADEVLVDHANVVFDNDLYQIVDIGKIKSGLYENL